MTSEQLELEIIGKFLCPVFVIFVSYWLITIATAARLQEVFDACIAKLELLESPDYRPETGFTDIERLRILEDTLKFAENRSEQIIVGAFVVGPNWKLCQQLNISVSEIKRCLKFVNDDISHPD